MSKTPRVEVVLHREFPEPVECPRYSGQLMFATACKVTWRKTPDYAGRHFSVTVFGARRKKDGELYKERLDLLVYGPEVKTWLERAGVTEATVAEALVAAADQINERNHP